MTQENNCGVMDRTIQACNPPVQNCNGIPRCGICGREIPNDPKVSEAEMEAYLNSYTKDTKDT